MNKQLLIYGALMGLLLIILEVINYRALMKQISLELYGALIGVVFLGFGIWIGSRLFRGNSLIVGLRKNKAEHLSGRELEVLVLLVEGFSNQEIVDQLFVSLNTVKTHISNVYGKLNVQRRTQAIKKARELGFL